MTSNLEDDVGIIITNLFISNSCALRGVNKIIRIADHYINARVYLLGAVFVSGNIADDWWNGQATYSADGVMTKQVRHLGFTINLHLAGYRANKATCLLLFKEERRDIGEILTGTSFVRRVCSATVNKGKLLVGKLFSYRIHRILHQEAHANDHICLLCLRGDVFGVFSITNHLRHNDQVRKTVLCSSLFVTYMSKLVKAAVIQATNV